NLLNDREGDGGTSVEYTRGRDAERRFAATFWPVAGHSVERDDDRRRRRVHYHPPHAEGVARALRLARMVGRRRPHAGRWHDLERARRYYARFRGLLSVPPGVLRTRALGPADGISLHLAIPD